MLVSWGAGRAGVAAGKGTRRPKTCVLSIELGQRRAERACRGATGRAAGE